MHRSLSAVAKVVAVLEALPAHRHLTTLARATGLPASTVHRILRELIALRWVTETEHRYSYGPLLLHLMRQEAARWSFARCGATCEMRCGDTAGSTAASRTGR